MTTPSQFSMERFLEQLRILQNQFDALNSRDHEDALAAVTEAVGSMRDATIRRRLEKEVELTLAWKAEKIIVERFAGDSSMIGLYGDPSTSSFDYDANSLFFESFGNKEPEFIWSQLSESTHCEGEQQRSKLELKYSNPTQSESEASRIAIKDTVFARHPSDERMQKSENVFTNNNGTETGKENNFICATCGYSANNRKGLYRHGQKTNHLLRRSRTLGSLACKFCPFRTNKTFNFNRHIKRFH